MKILQLNVWMGKVEGELKRFLEGNDFDVICMQEVMASSDTGHLSRLCFDLDQIKEASRLPYDFFASRWRCRISDGHMEVGNLILSRIPFQKKQSEFINGEFIEDMVLGQDKHNNVNVQIAELENGLIVVNRHGYWYPSPVGDEKSVEVFSKLRDVVLPFSEKGPLVLCGDLNVIYESPAMRSLDFLRDLTFENRIKSTLSGLKFNGEVACDHIMVNEGVRVNRFEVVSGCFASDHLPVVAEIGIGGSGKKYPRCVRQRGRPR